MRTSGLFEREADRAAYEDYIAALAGDDSAFRAAFREAFFRALKEQLTGRQYEVLWLNEVEGLSGKEIAYKLGISQSAVSRHLTRGRRGCGGCWHITWSCAIRASLRLCEKGLTNTERRIYNCAIKIIQRSGEA